MKQRISNIIRKLKTFGSFTVLKQIVNPKNIPLIIINYNQLFYLKKLVDFALKTDFKNIIIIDNVSTYPPLLDYYKEVSSKGVVIEQMDRNYGHMVLFEQDILYNKYCKGLFILSDSDIVPNPNLPKDFMSFLIKLLFNQSKNILKVGFALDISDIPETNKLKQKIINWEKQFWQNTIANNLYLANIDTTFALYKPNPKKFMTSPSKFYRGIRVGGNYTCKHGGWYIDHKNLTCEQDFYLKLATTSSSWKIDENGEIIGHHKNTYNS